MKLIAIILIFMAQVGLSRGTAEDGGPSKAYSILAEKPFQTFEGFDDDPGWIGINNRATEPECRVINQNFGYSDSSFAASSIGEIGGHIERASEPAFYGMILPSIGFDQPLSASGKVAVPATDGAGALFGWFNKESEGWRTPNSLVFRLDSESSYFRVLYEYGTRTWKTNGEAIRDGAGEYTRFDSGETVYDWEIHYDPAANGGDGRIDFNWNGVIYPLDLLPGHKEVGIDLNRFGIMNLMVPSGGIDAYIGDIMLNGNPIDLSSDPDWDGFGNRASHDTCLVRPRHNFGWNPEGNFASGSDAGEIGGVVYRVETNEPETYAEYGADVGELSLNDPLYAEGNITFERGNSDSAVTFGWYKGATLGNVDRYPEQFCGWIIEGPSRVGFYFRPAVAGMSEKRHTDDGPIIMPDGSTHHWTMTYDPGGADGLGELTLTLDDEEKSVALAPGMKNDGSMFDRFGMIAFRAGGHYVDVYLDDIEFTTANAAHATNTVPTNRWTIY